MYAVVGCRECGAYWVVEGAPETTRCPRCSTRHRFEKLHRFAEADDPDAAREARSRIVREQAGADVDDLEDFASMEDRIDEAGVDDAAYLAGSGIDPAETEAAADRATAGTERRSRREVLLDGIRRLEAPTEDDLTVYAAEHGVSAAYVRRTIERLRRAGDVTETDGHYRLL